jgi:phage baseplate assembly protein W
MDNADKAFLGTGWAFPPAFDLASNRVRMVSAEADIVESLQILLSTSLGERVVQPTYGCNLQDYLFEPLSPTIASSIKEQIRVSILYHEPRIILNGLDLSLDDQIQGRVNFTVDYTVINTNSRFNVVYPFYQEEGTGALLPAATGPGELVGGSPTNLLQPATS